MKTAKPLPSELSSSRRAQPVRQTRTNPRRSSIQSARPFGPRASLCRGLEEKDIDIFPAITHFADAVTALPKELMRHFTLLKEVDAKIFAPEDDLGRLVDAALNTPLPERPAPIESRNGLGPGFIPISAQGSTNGSIVNGHPASVTSIPDADVTLAYHPANIHRRQLFSHCAYTMQNMLVSLDEKNHVISTAAEALNKQLAHIDECFPHVKSELSEEARYGSATHWAYPENRVGKSGPAHVPRREVPTVSHLSAAAQQLADEAAARSDARKQAIIAKKTQKQTHADSDNDEAHDGKHKDNKKAHGNSKARKAADASLAVGLGITNGINTNGNAPKRRKIEKGPTGGVVMERALSGVFGNNATTAKSKGASPRGTPAPDQPKKKPRATANGHSRKRNNTVTSAMSPSIASSPIRSTFPDSKVPGRVSPPPSNVARPATSRARQNSTQSIAENGRQRQESVASTKQNGNSTTTPDQVPAAAVTGRTTTEAKAAMKESASSSKAEQMLEAVQLDPEVVGGVVGNRKEAVKHEEPEINGGPVQAVQQTTIVTTKSGRASKPSTPAMPSFPDPPRSRSARNNGDNALNNKRSHKKGAGAAAQLIAQQNLAADDSSSNMQEDEEEEEIGENEPTYCYCNGVSYGEMVACDADDCEKEWFHLECVGLKVAPRGNAKWYCNDCKEKTRLRRFNSR
ncbi:hypothetical protein BJ875DRAFT_148289 [Amylocarpus encephaloides]|uniref:Chromatin modification-related protein n=1 Tax=Amylocarpus encephaloides TaxID=45428 RepID=A0A9P7YUW8_9HELO|nr:hypothetical protein BJ875DRAFT_148289 [Amylocarpus encephaloides]